jgi:hypothetical protein
MPSYHQSSFDPYYGSVNPSKPGSRRPPVPDLLLDSPPPERTRPLFDDLDLRAPDPSPVPRPNPSREITRPRDPPVCPSQDTGNPSIPLEFPDTLFIDLTKPASTEECADNELSKLLKECNDLDTILFRGNQQVSYRTIDDCRQTYDKTHSVVNEIDQSADDEGLYYQADGQWPNAANKLRDAMAEDKERVELMNKRFESVRFIIRVV